MSSSDYIRAMVEFWRQFHTSLYDAGFGDMVSWSGATKAEDRDEAVVASAYMKGAADMARIAVPYMSARWQIANLVGIAAGTFTALLRSEDVVTVTEEQVRRLTRVYVAEIKELVERVRAEQSEFDAKLEEAEGSRYGAWDENAIADMEADKGVSR